ncbi:MAG: hypothetical protein ACN6OD_18675, partial [Alcaligenes sp.]
MTLSRMLKHGPWLMLLGLAPLAAMAGSDRTAGPGAAHALQLTPYLWVTGLKGDVSPFKRGPTIGIEKSFSDVWRDLNAGGFVKLWARRARYVLSGDLLYVDSSESRIVDGLPLPGALEGKVDNRLFMASLQGGYRILQLEQASLDVLAGASFWDVSTRARLQAGPLSTSYRESFNWVDPMIGLRAFYRFDERFSVQAQAGLGGGRRRLAPQPPGCADLE